MKDNEILNSVSAEKLSRIAIILILIEFKKAYDKHPPYNSCHEGISIIREEFEELWDEVKKNESLHDKKKMLAEATQVASTALRFMVDCCLSKK